MLIITSVSIYETSFSVLITPSSAFVGHKNIVFLKKEMSHDQWSFFLIHTCMCVTCDCIVTAIHMMNVTYRCMHQYNERFTWSHVK